jgi:2-octaprenyl-6-methoxyphenol hydroxylase
MSTLLETDFDIVIAGGGMIGISMALAISSLDLRIAVIEKIERDHDKQPSFDDRSTALSRSSQSMFTALGLWDEIRDASKAIKTIHVSDKGRFGFSHISAKEQEVEALGYVVINRVLGDVLLNSVAKKKNIKLFCPAEITSIEPHKDYCDVSFKSQSSKSKVSSQLLIVADGTNSSTRDYLGIGVKKTNYDQIAIIGNLLTEKPIDNRAFERFSESGPLALLPIENGRTAFIWILPTNKAENLLAATDEIFLSSMQETFGLRLGLFSNLGKRSSYPLALTEAQRLYASRSVVIGNAANSLHPVAAQGFNLGLRDVATLADCLCEELKKDKVDFGNVDLLSEYSDWRQQDHQKLKSFTDGLVRLYGNSRKSIRVLRGVGMVCFDLMPGFRKFFVKHTMGLVGRLPRLSRGISLK